MSSAARDPYAVLGVDPGASDAEIRAAYRRLVKRYHPDHNGGSEESERRFEEVQDAYARARALRAGGASAGSAGPRVADDLDARLAEMERELHRTRQARERAERARQEAIRAAREAANAAAAANARRPRPDRPSDEDLGYFSTDDSFSKILSDAREALADHLDDLADNLKREGPDS